MGKHDPLRDHLETRGSRVVMAFDEIVNATIYAAFTALTSCDEPRR